MSVFGVVIPFFQRRPGVLASSLESVAGQDVGVPVRVVVVDDSSPVRAEQEVARVSFPSNFSVEIIRQANAGAGMARNRGIDALADVDYVAFLDSDDYWASYHLSSALLAFDYGFDYYTAETEDGGSGLRYLSHFFKDGLPLRPAGFAPWANELTEPLIDFTVAGPISTSSVFVVRNSLIGPTRFDPSLRTAGEDGLFRTMLAATSPRTLVSDRRYFGIDALALRAAAARVVSRVAGLPPERARVRGAFLRQDFGLDTVDGLDMLIGQAALAFELFFGRPPPEGRDDELRALLPA